MFRNGRGQRRHNAASLFEHAQFKCYGRADNLILPLERNGKAPRPFRPILTRALFPVACDDTRGIGQRFVCPKNKRHILVQDEACFGENIGNRRVSRDSE